MPLRCVLWDFGDTLVDERWMLRPPPGIPEWPHAWSATMDELAQAWDLGEIGLQDVVAAVASRLRRPAAEVRQAVQWCCAHLAFFALPWHLAQQCALPQALVTVNPDVFSHLIAPHYGLHHVFNTIVTSWQARTLDKGRMCQVALACLGGNMAPGEALLIDNKPVNVASWGALGGRGYVYRDQHTFKGHLANELSDLAQAAGVRVA